MKIGVVSIGNDSLELFDFLHRYDHDYHIYYDVESWPLGEKSSSRATAIVEAWIEYLVSKKVDAIIVPPLFELLLAKTDTVILPLFSDYLLCSCFPWSLIGKIWLLVDPVHTWWEAQKLVHLIEKTYKLSSNQSQTKGFHSPMTYREKDVSLWPLLQRSLSPRDYLINKVVKFDLSYLKDAAIDTIIPTNYSHFAMEKTIIRYHNQKKQKFHGVRALERSFEKVTSSKNPSNYSVTVHYIGRNEMLTERKKYLWSLQRGKESVINFVEIV